MMGGTAGDDSESEEPLRSAAHQLVQGERIAHTAAPQVHGEGDGVAVEVEDERDQGVAAHAVKAEPKRKRDCGRRVGGIELAMNDFFANGGPSDFTAQCDRNAVL